VAQPAPQAKRTPSQKDLTAARRHFQDAEAAKARGEYQTAAVEYLAAYELFQEPAFFYNIAEVYKLAGDEKNALVYYQKYLELDPQGTGAANARSSADLLRRAIAAQEDAAKRAADVEAKAKRAGAADAEAKRAATAAATRDTQTKHPAGGERHRMAVATPPEGNPEGGPKGGPKGNPKGNVDIDGADSQRDAGRGLRLAGIGAAGAGVVAIGIGVVFGLKARSISDEAAGWDAFDPGRYDQGKAGERNMFVLTGLGAAAVVTGGVL
jgi:tetratricopeptide (TPR) repeat protein